MVKVSSETWLVVEVCARAMRDELYRDLLRILWFRYKETLCWGPRDYIALEL